MVEITTGVLGAGGFGKTTLALMVCADQRVRQRFRGYVYVMTMGQDANGAPAVAAKVNEVIKLLHDVVRDFLRGELKRQQRLASLDEALVDAVAGALPAPAPGPGPATGLARVAWWELDRTDRYMWDHLIQHLREAGRFGEAEDVACDLRWAGARVEGCGPAALAADLSAVSTPRAGRLGAVLARVAHLLAPADPARAVVDILHSRVADDPDWGPQASALRDLCPVPRLANRWHLPDLPNAALRRVLTGHAGWVNSAAVGVAGDRVVTGGADGTARIWDPLAGQERAVLAGDAGPVTAVAASPDGSWLITGSSDRTARVWDPATWTEHAVLAVLAGHDRAITAVAVCPDGSWAVTGSEDKTARIWDLGTGQMHAVLAGHDGAVIAAAVCPGGGWLITGSEDGTARIWDAGQAASGRAAGIVRPAPTAVGVASAPVGLTSGDRHRTERPVVAGAITAAATAQDGSWLASGGADGTVRIRDAASAAQRAVCTGHGEAITAIAAATDYGWLVTGSRDRTARIWDAATGEQQQVLAGAGGAITAVATAPDGSWLVCGSADGTIRIWDLDIGRERAVLAAHDGPVTAVATSPDGSWLLSSGERAVRVWDLATWKTGALMRVDSRVCGCAWAGAGGIATWGAAGLYLFDFLSSHLQEAGDSSSGLSA
jgi:WD40 repeat protein